MMAHYDKNAPTEVDQVGLGAIPASAGAEGSKERNCIRKPWFK